MDIFFGVDGTGPDDNVTYSADFENSHVRTMWKTWHTTSKGYIRGPSLAGSETAALRDKGLIWIKDELAKHKIAAGSGDQNRVFLAGYSRGGAAVISLSYKLMEAGIPVHAMMLFDAVDRSSIGNTDTIPFNVGMCFHALRDPKAGSRESFGNCGRKWNPAVAYTEKTFFCTHGGVGGTPWKKNGKSGKIEELETKHKVAATLLGGYAGKKLADEHDFTNVTVEQDKQGSAASWTWMEQKLKLARASKEADGICSFGTLGKTREN